jgi:hypothetical protein
LPCEPSVAIHSATSYCGCFHLPCTHARTHAGKQSLLQRRRLSAACFNGPDYKRPDPLEKPCDCTVEQDLECDYGFMRAGARVGVDGGG